MDSIKNIKVLKNEKLSKHTTFKVGGEADFVIFPKYKDALIEVIHYLRDEGIPYIILGNGSNVLFTESGFRGAVIKLTKMEGMTLYGSYLKVKCGTLMSKIGAFCLDNNLKGFEQLAGIPGTVGGAVFMNAGAYGREISDILVQSEYLDRNGDLHILNRDDHDFSYRHSFYEENRDLIILSATFELNEGKKEEILALMNDCKEQRASKQPIEYPSAGSTFKRPEGHFAGKLIEDCGLKGFTVGGAKVSEKHAGFVINYKKATASDVLEVINTVRDEVYKKYQVNLECEVKIVGE